MMTLAREICCFAYRRLETKTGGRINTIGKQRLGQIAISLWNGLDIITLVIPDCISSHWSGNIIVFLIQLCRASRPVRQSSSAAPASWRRPRKRGEATVVVVVVESLTLEREQLYYYTSSHCLCAVWGGGGTRKILKGSCNPYSCLWSSDACTQLAMAGALLSSRQWWGFRGGGGGRIRWPRTSWWWWWERCSRLKIWDRSSNTCACETSGAWGISGKKQHQYRVNGEKRIE